MLPYCPKLVVIELWLGSYLMNVFKMTKELYFIDTLETVKSNKTLPFGLYESIQLLMRVL